MPSMEALAPEEIKALNGWKTIAWADNRRLSPTVIFGQSPNMNTDPYPAFPKWPSNYRYGQRPVPSTKRLLNDYKLNPNVYQNAFRINAVREHFSGNYPDTLLGQTDRHRDIKAHIDTAMPRIRAALESLIESASGRQVFVAAFGEVARDAVHNVVRTLQAPGSPDLPYKTLDVRSVELATCSIQLLFCTHPSPRAEGYHPLSKIVECVQAWSEGWAPK